MTDKNHKPPTTKSQMTQAVYAEKMNLAWRLIMASQHFGGKPLACVDALANSNSLEDMQTMEKVLANAASEALAIAKNHKDDEVRKALGKLGGSINHTLAMRF